MKWSDIKKKGNVEYKGQTVEPIDLMREGGILRDFAIGNIIKYAYRNRRDVCGGLDIDKQDIEKIIHYAEMLLADLEEEEK